MADTFKTFATALDSPARSAAGIAPNDGADLGTVSRAIYVGAAGDLRVELVNGGDVTFAGATGLLPICVSRVYATGTTAASIVALW